MTTILLTDLARRSGRTTEQVLAAIKSGELVGYRAGALVRIDRDSAARWLANTSRV